MLDAICDELEDLGSSGGGAVDAKVRRAALATFGTFGPDRRGFPQRWRHRYAVLPYEDLVWTTGRIRIPSVERATGLVHAGSTYLAPPSRAGDPRIVLTSLADAKRSAPSAVAAIHRTIVPTDADRFVALSTAFQNCGAYVDIPAGVELDEAVPIVWTARPGPHGAIFPHTVIRLGERARATIVERHLGESESFLAGIVEIDLGAGARLDYVMMQQADDGSRLIVRRAARCAEGASIGWHLAELGGALSRSAFDVMLDERGSDANINALYFAMGFANVDLTVDVDHAAEDTASQTVVRSVAKDIGLGRFAGDIRIGSEAHRTRASMRADALVLSRDAYAEAIPALEIDTNDVSAYHAATVGSLDEEQLFYAQSRGINRSNAERMVALAFFEPAIAGFPSEALREEVRAALDSRLEEVPETFAQ